MKKTLPITLSVLVLFASCAKTYENSSQWIKTSIGGYPYVDFQYTDFFITLTDTTLDADSKDPSFEGMYLKVATRITGPGTYNVTDFTARVSSSPEYMAGTYAEVPPAGTVTIDEFGPVGGFVIGRFSVPTHTSALDTSAASAYNFSGSFLVRRRR